jgi:hypothetical protein
MSFYKELNDINTDFSEYQEIPLSDMEKKRIMKGFKKKIKPGKKKKWLGASVAIIAAFVLSLSLTLDKGTIASMPFVGGIVEKYKNQNETLDYSSYKTAIGDTAENARGKLTLNEVMLDDQQLVLSATFEPADGVRFDYQTFLAPKVKINGQDFSVTTGGESIELNDDMFTVYNNINLSKTIETEDVHIEISYATWQHKLQDFEVIEQPWTFDVQVSQANLLAEKKVFELNKLITLNNGEIVTIEKVVSTPISTTVYYDLSQSKSEKIYFLIQSEEGKTERFSEAFTSNDNVGDVSYVRFNGFTFENTKYYLVAYDDFLPEGKQLNESPIPIN